MPYDEKLDARIGKAITRWKGTSHKKMFGGVGHLLHGAVRRLTAPRCACGA